MILAFTPRPAPRGPERELRERHPSSAPGLFHRSRLPRLFLALTFTFTASLLPAVELAPGLVYLRPGTDIPPQTGSAVLDLRAVTADADAAALLAAVAPGAANDRRVVLALISPATPDGVLRQLSSLPRTLTIGRAALDFKTHIAVTTSAEADQTAASALAAGTAPDRLLVENADKPRYDEASLMREHATGPEQPELAAAPTDAPASETATTEPAKATPFDAVLQRAVHIYRGLVTLNKL